MVQTSSTDFSQYSQAVRVEIEAALVRSTEFSHDCPQRLREAICHSLLAPCKRLRPLLVLMAAEACGYERSGAMPAACAVEMVHTYSLIHDDLPAMDDDDLRRGRASCHAAFGEATAILAGDALLALAFESLASGIEPPETAARCCGELAKAAGAEALVGGQIDDLSAEFSDGDIEKLKAIHRRKTGAMFCVSLRLGGIVGQASDEQLAALDAYGRYLGLAFQIVDDLLDLKGDEKAMGKRIGKDSQHGKLTFPALLGVEASQSQAEQLVAQALDALAAADLSASNLEALGGYVLERNH